jgi:CheY-like chemotaxis protein
MNAVSRPRLLLVEDDPGMRRLLQLCLRQIDADPLIAADGRQALTLLQRGSVDLVITDLMMPQVGGFELVQQLRRTPALQHIPAIVLSLIGDPDLPRRAEQAGAQAYFVKPFSPSQLAATVRKFMPS